MVVHRSTQPYMFHALFAQYFVTMQCLLAAVGNCDVHLFKHLHLYLDITFHNPLVGATLWVTYMFSFHKSKYLL